MPGLIPFARQDARSSARREARSAVELTTLGAQQVQIVDILAPVAFAYGLLEQLLREQVQEAVGAQPLACAACENLHDVDRLVVAVVDLDDGGTLRPRVGKVASGCAGRTSWRWMPHIVS